MKNEIKEKYRALLVEDELSLQNVIRKKLEKEDFQVATARSVEQAMQHLKNIMKVDIIWLDHYLLGKEDGLDFLARIKQNDSKWKKIPVFVVSNTATSDKIKSYINLGADKYYTKSDCKLDDILFDVKKYLKDN